jgi:hypothetical protein
MKKNVLVFGLILGTIITANAVYMMTMITSNPSFRSNDILGYTAMVVVFSLTFFGIRNYRNKELGGVISFGRAFKTGALIALVGSTMYVVVGLLYYYFFVPDFLDKYIAHVLQNVPPADLPAKTKEMEQFKEMYKNPLFAILISYSEVLPVGLVVAFVGSLILKRKAKAATAGGN